MDCRPHLLAKLEVWSWDGLIMGKIWKNMTGHQKMVDMICI
jgi:hypothetical protein